MLPPRRALRLDAVDYRIALQEVDGLLCRRCAVAPPVIRARARAPAATSVALGPRRVRIDRRPFLEVVLIEVPTPQVERQDVVEVAVVLPLLPRRAPLLPRHRQANHQCKDVCQEAARPWGHRHNRSTQPSRRLLPLEQRQRLARRELQEHVHILDQLALLESPRARERIPPQAQKELDLRCRLVLNSLELDAADRLGPILELRHAARRASGRRSRGAQVIDVHRHGDGQGTRSARHIEDDVDKEYLKRPRHAARAEIAIEMTEQVLPRSFISMKPVEQEGPDPRGKWQHRESCFHI